MNLLAAFVVLLPLFILPLYHQLPLLILMKSFFSRKRKSSSGDLLVPRKMIQQTSRLLDLPDEILINIVGHLEYVDLLATRAVSTHLQDLAEPFIYDDYRIDNGRKSQRLAAIITRNPERAQWLRSVLVSTKFGDDRGLWLFPEQLRQMRNLKHLILETPDCNAKVPADRVTWIMLQEEYESILRDSSLDVPREKRVLGHLQTCTIHLVDEDSSLYALPKYSSIFLHPTLRSLTLSCACTDLPENMLPSHRKYQRSTALEYLHLEECDIDCRTLEILLQFPESLKSLKISEGTRYGEGWGGRAVRMHGNVIPSDLSSALTRSVGDSLETLSLCLGFHNRMASALNYPARALDLRYMTRLKDLALSWHSLTLVCPRPVCDHAIYRRLPATIETLRVFGIPLIALRGGPLIPLNSCVYKEKVTHGLPKLRTVFNRYEFHAPNGRASRGMISRSGASMINQISEAYLGSIHRSHRRRLRMYKKADVRIVIELETTPAGFIPPYLDNEAHPTIETTWDSDDIQIDVSGTSYAAVAAVRKADSDEDEQSSEEDEITIGGRRLLEIVPRMEDLMILLASQPGHGLPV